MLKSLSYSLLIALLLTGCILDDLSDCQQTYISFFYSADGDGKSNLIGSYINDANLFIYDKNNQLAHYELLNSSVLRADTEMKLDLSPGDYTIVCWGHANENTQIISKENLKSGRVHAPGYNTEKKITSNDELYFASKKIKVLGNNIRTDDIVKFKSAHIKFDFLIKGLDSFKENEHPKLIIYNLTPQYNFEMQATQGFNSNYYPEIKRIDKTKNFSGKTNVLRFSQNNSIKIDLLNTKDESLLNEKIDLNKLLQDLPEDKKIDLNKQEVKIPIHIEFKGIQTIIKIVDWTNEDVIPVLE